ncbi:GATA transcription factor 21 [Cajanus cajan]|uniref:GATA transcription factor 20 n=1 Tax=Cajanus cajan TaxID=3821 RepID=A0A151SWY9_CAJCA|nr:GATA transcription factor 21 [Cajanus cajan]XP_020224492.1 GATA transcription factor 21 [Cajanus cajan]XP_029128640.1 GATA transcription factor 21 [Cajanus cajan]KYP59312.1 Putative GATA transcription factor 20 [Cajanus cajan]
MPMDLNDDHTHQLFGTNHQASSSSSLPYSILFNQDQDQGGSYHEKSKHLQSDEEAEKIDPSGGSWDHPIEKNDENRSDLKQRVWKKKDRCENLQGEDSSRKWMPSKIRMMRKMMVSDIKSVSNSKQIKCEEKNSPLSPQGPDNINYSSSSNHSNITVRVCADCHTTETPLWRTGPNGPKSLCNACGIRQRKARRAIAAAASANGTSLVEPDKSQVKKGKKLHKKRMKSKAECAPQLKKKRKLGDKYRKRFENYEDLTISLSKNLDLQQVFPQDEKEAAILLMALSYGLRRDFPSDHYVS